MLTSLFYLGDLTAVNAVTDLYGASNYLTAYDQVIISYPYSLGNYGVIGPVSANNAPNIVKAAQRPVWVLIDLAPSAFVQNAAQAYARAQTLMQFFAAEFTRYFMLDLLAGFYITNFGFTATPYADNTQLSRNDQNNIVSLAHVTYGKPVAVSGTYVSELFTDIAPAGRSPIGTGEAALEEFILGKNAAIPDMVLMIDTLLSDDGVGQVSVLAENLAVLKKYTSLLNLTFVAVQQLDMSAYSVDNLIGLNFADPLKTKIRDALRVLGGLGFPNFAIADIPHAGEYSNKLVPPELLTPESAYVSSTFNTLYSTSGQVIVKRPALNINAVPSIATDIYDANFNWVSTVIP